MVGKKRVFLPALPGMNVRTLFEILARDGNRIDIQYFPRLVILFGFGVVNSVLGCIERYQSISKIQAERMPEEPVFIIGFFRSGTTFLQNLLSHDDNFVSPSSYFCMFPNHFHYSKKIGVRIMNHLAPGKRPMDNIKFDGNVPFEDEFALAALSSVSPYFRFLFPNSDNNYMALDPQSLPDKALTRWKEAMCYLMKSISFWKDKRQILLKSPLHTGRVGTLLEMFPKAKFIHIVRNPYHVYQSNKSLWEKTLCRMHMQFPDPTQIEEIILSWYTEIFSLLERDRPLIPKGSLVEIKFEDLEKNPIDTLEGIYEQLNLKDFDEFKVKLLNYMNTKEKYRKNIYNVDPLDIQRVGVRWEDFFERYGYAR